MSTWTDERKAQAIKMYKESEPTPENSMEIVNEIAAEMGESANGVRMILNKANEYVKKTPAAKGAAAGGEAKTGGTRVSKEAAHKQLTDAIENAGGKVDSEIIGKLTGKAALYLAEVIEGTQGE